MRKIITLLIAVAALTGCGDERPQAEKKPPEITAKVIDPKDLRIDRLEKEAAEQNFENFKLKKEVEKLTADSAFYQQKIAEYKSEKFQNQEAVAVATACDWLIPVCPTATVQAGRDLIAKGHAVPDDDLHALMMRKGGLLLMLSGVLALSLLAVWALLARPSLAKRKQAVEDVRKATEMARTAHESAQEIVGKAHDEAKSIVFAAQKNATKDAENRAAEILHEVAVQQKKLKALSMQLESLETTREDAKKAAKDAQKEADAKAQEVAELDALIARKKAIADAMKSFDL